MVPQQVVAQGSEVESKSEGRIRERWFPFGLSRSPSCDRRVGRVEPIRDKSEFPGGLVSAACLYHIRDGDVWHSRRVERVELGRLGPQDGSAWRAASGTWADLRDSVEWPTNGERLQEKSVNRV